MIQSKRDRLSSQIRRLKNCLSPGSETASSQDLTSVEAGDAGPSIGKPTDDRTGLEIVSVHGLKALVDRTHDPAVIQRGLDCGWYEASEVFLARAILKPGDRVLELGAGMGLVTAAMAKIVGVEAVAAYEPNPSIAERARENLALNAVPCDIRARLCRPRSASAQSARFRLATVFWASSLEMEGTVDGEDGGDRIITVPVEPLEDAIKAHRANVLVMDIEGGELEILRSTDLSGLRALIFETHEEAVGRRATNEAIQAACARGFLVDYSLTREGVVALRRDEAPIRS